MPVSTAIRPTANSVLPSQSILAGRPEPLSVSWEEAQGGAEEANGHEPEDPQPPLDRSEYAAEDQADERAADRRDAVDAHGLAALVLRAGVGQDRAGVREEQRTADALEHPHDDDPQDARHSGQEGHREQDRECGEDGEAQVVHLDPAVDIADAPEADH